MNLKTNTRTFEKKKNTHPDKRARVENDKFCVFVTVFVAVYLFVCFVFWRLQVILSYNLKKKV